MVNERPNETARLYSGVGVLLAALSLLLPGCAHYHPEPLSPVAVQQQLRRYSLADFASEYCKSGRLGTAPDISAGLGPDEAGLAALIMNPGLKAKRLELGIAAGQLVTAGLYPNPSFDTRVLPASQHPIHHKNVEGSFSIEVLRWQERLADKQTKAASIQVVHYEILNEEWKTVSDARAAYWTAVAAHEKQRLNSTEIGLSERTLDSVKKRKTLGAGTSLDANMALLQHLKLQMEQQKFEADVDAAERALKAVIGLPYDAELKLRIPSDPLARPAHSWKLPELVASLPNSATLKAAEWHYEISEGELRAAIARQYPSMKLGPAATFDFDGHIWSSLYGMVGAVDIPLFNRGQGEIQEKCAARDVARAEYAARLHTAEAAVAAAAAVVESTGKRLQFVEQSLMPRTIESMQLTEKTYAAGDIAGSDLLAARTLSIESEKSYLDLLIEHRQALEALEALLGRRLEDVSTSGGSR